MCWWPNNYPIKKYSPCNWIYFKVSFWGFWALLLNIVLLQLTVQRPFTDSQIQVQADNKCRDGKALFEGVSAIVVSYPIAKSSHLVTKPKTSDAKEGVLSFRLTPKSINGEQSFQLASTFIEGSSSRIDLKPYSIDSDYCVEAPGKSAKGADGPDEECTLKLAAKAYQLDVLVDQLVARQKRIEARHGNGACARQLLGRPLALDNPFRKPPCSALE